MPDEEAVPPAEASTTGSSTADGGEQPENSGEFHDVGGYPTMAEFMAHGSNFANVRGFAYLNALNILYFQAELVDLERELKAFDKADRASPDPSRRRYYRSWEDFSKHENDPALKDTNWAQWNTVMKIREVLKQYSKVLPASYLDAYFSQTKL
jgi:hypothetical protein